MPQTAIKVGPQDHGRHMSLAEFEHAEVHEGYLYELGRGVVVVSDVPHPCHLAQIDCARDQFAAYRLTHRGRICCIAAGSDCKILVEDLESERHPDLSIYKTRPPRSHDPWRRWIPEIVIEVVSLSSEMRDYYEKREEYLLRGIKEYWILDAERQQLTVLRRVAQRWDDRTIRPPKLYRTRLLPGFAFDCGAVFHAAAEDAGE